jgi:branched-chain amino acid transport system permease protein
LALTVISVAIALWLKASRFGARLAAIRENEDSARALGINIFSEKIKIMAISGAIAGVGGCFFSQYFLYIDPTIVFGVDKSVEMLLVSMIGGAGTVYGPLIGAVLLALVSEVTRSMFSLQVLSLVLSSSLLSYPMAWLNCSRARNEKRLAAWHLPPKKEMPDAQSKSFNQNIWRLARR